MLTGKTILVGVTGGIAAYKTAELVSRLKKAGANVHVLMTKNATHFVNPITFETLSGNKALIDTFDRNFIYSVEHVALAKVADAVIIAPVTANTIAKLNYGMADNMLTTTVLACNCPKICAPAMNTGMLNNPATKENIDGLKKQGWTIVESQSGYLACGDVGQGKMEEPWVLFEYVRRACSSQDLLGKKVLVTGGATGEAIDPVRYITNKSTGKMGIEIAKMAWMRGADVTLVHGLCKEQLPVGVRTVAVTSAQEMFEAVEQLYNDYDFIIKSAAVADYRPSTVHQEKMKKKEGSMVIEMERTTDILSYLGKHKKEGQFLCGFSMETENLIENSKQKLDKKGADLIVANNLRDEGAGFATSTNKVTFITKEQVVELPLMEKWQVANAILDVALMK